MANTNTFDSYDSGIPPIPPLPHVPPFGIFPNGLPQTEKWGPFMGIKQRPPRINELLRDLQPGDLEYDRMAEIRTIIERVFSSSHPESNESEMGIFGPVDQEMTFEQLGKGGFGQVYKGIDKKTGKVFAFKKIPRGHNFSFEFILGEAKALRQLSGGKNVLEGYVVRQSGPNGISGIPDSKNDYFIVTEFLDGMDGDKIQDNVEKAIRTMGFAERARTRAASKNELVKMIQESGLGRFAPEEMADLMNFPVSHDHDTSFSELPEWVSIQSADIKNLAKRFERIYRNLVIRSAVDVLKALESAHARGLVHKDIKPANIMFTPQGVKLIDFGLAGPIDSPETTADFEFISGTLQYISPEQAWMALRKVDRSTLIDELPLAHEIENSPSRDLYAMGVALFKMISGVMPYGETDGSYKENVKLLKRIAAKGSAPDIKKNKPDIPDELAEIVNSMIYKIQAERPTVGEAKEALQRFLYRERDKEELRKTRAQMAREVPERIGTT